MYLPFIALIVCIAHSFSYLSSRMDKLNSMGYLSQLLAWNLEDPPDAEEVERNGKVCTGELRPLARCHHNIELILSV